MKKLKEVDSYYNERNRSPRHKDDDEYISRKRNETDSYSSDKTRSPRFRDDEDFITRSKLNRNTSASNTSLNNGQKSARVSSNSSISRKSVADLPQPKSAYGPIAHSVRKIVPQDIACKLGCRGNKCKYDSSDWPSDKMVLNGIFSHW